MLSTLSSIQSLISIFLFVFYLFMELSRKLAREHFSKKCAVWFKRFELFALKITRSKHCMIIIIIIIIY